MNPVMESGIPYWNTQYIRSAPLGDEGFTIPST